jgi:hypothetical protein
MLHIGMTANPEWTEDPDFEFRRMNNYSLDPQLAYKE